MNDSIEVDGVVYGPTQIRLMRMQLRGYRAAEKVVLDETEHARARVRQHATRARKTKKLDYWKGRFEGLVAAHCVMVYGEFPERNAETIDQILG